MANRRSGKLWTPGLLKSRGWTKELMAQLLPRPQYRRFNGRSVPHWHRDDVRAAEATAAFQAKSRGALPPPTAGHKRQRQPPFWAGPGRTPPGRKPGLGCWPDIITWPLPSLPAAAQPGGCGPIRFPAFNQFLPGNLAAMRPSSGGAPPLLSKRVSGWGSSRRSRSRVGQGPVSRGSPGRRGTGHRQLHRRPAGGRSAGAAADEGLSRLSAALPNLGLSLLRLLCSPSHPHQLRGPHGPEPQGRVP